MIQYLRLHFYLLCFFSFIGCREYHTADDGIFFQNFDDYYWWSGRAISITDANSFSGKFSTFAGASSNFSHTFEINGDYLLENNYETMYVSAYTYRKNQSCNAKIVLSVEYNGNISLYKDIKLDDQRKYANRWERQNMEVKLVDIKKESKIKVYLLSECQSPTYMDDVVIRFFR